MAANVQSMCQYWKNFDLHELQKELDTSATELASRQDESDASRKRLVEQSRDFKKNTPEDVRKVVAPLLKSFQLEIDALSKRSKAAEAAFLSVYKKLIDVPDPVSVLEQALQLQKKVQKAQDLEIENKQLRETLEEYNNEFAEVKNQEVTIKQLKEKVKEYEEKMETEAQTRAREKERELQRQFTEKERLLQETQMSVAKKLGEAEQKVGTLQSALESTQSELFDLKAKHDETTSAKSDETEMLVADLERANERAVAAEREVENLKTSLHSATQDLSHAEEMQKAPDMEQAIDILKRSSLEVELAAKEKEITQLVEDVQRLQSAVNKLRDTGSSQLAKLEEELAAKSRAFSTLEEKMKTQEDYEEIKRELNILKSIEFANVGDDKQGEEAKPKSLEMLLLEKNRGLQTENTQIKAEKNDVSESPENPIASVAIAMLGQELAATYWNTNSPCSSQELPTNMQSPASGVSPGGSTTSGKDGKENTPTSTDQSPLSATKYARLGNGPVPPEFMNGITLHRLTSMARQDSNGSVLDTAEVALKIRELLSTHNIGQRLFAKNVLGLSQGTVSELLSKPKHWDKLTEKGRESYRKMNAWSMDEKNIYALKAISPKKGGTPMMSSVKPDDAATEERISRILSDAQQAMQKKQTVEHAQVTSAMVQSIYQQELARMAMNNSQGTPTGRRGYGLHPKPELDREQEASISQDIVSRIYQEELAKLAYAAQRAGNLAESTLYQQELAKLAKNVRSRSSSVDSRSPGAVHVKTERVEVGGVTIKKERTDSEDSQTEPTDLSKRSSPSSKNEDNLRHAGSAFFLVRPRSNGHGGFDPMSAYAGVNDSLSPLQKMQSIANSLSLQAQSPSHLPQKPLKPVLPPITQEQFDRYSNLNTDDLVRKVKDTLSQYSISQRLFGENVLGLSQGSVSDLLARPKPWHMLTQKGREPFIRMQIFLEDKEAIPRLVANQYKIAPEKLMRSHGSYGPYPATAESPFDTTGVPNQPQPPPAHQQPPMVLPEAIKRERSPSTPDSIASNPQPSVYEVAAMTTELDTLAVTCKVKEVLLFHNLGQKLFGESILGLSQGSVSELLSKPKPWHMLSLKGREPFIKMQMWLNDPTGIDRLRAWHNEYKGRHGRKRRGSSDERSVDSPNLLPGKKPRVFFTDEQKEALRLAYAQDPYPNQNTIEFLAQQLGVHSKTVINWFHNHRMRAKQQRPDSRSTPQSLSNSYPHLKMELTDDLSNQSECSDSNASGRAVFNRETSQWCFPTFEAVQAEENGKQSPGCDGDKTEQKSGSRPSSSTGQVETTEQSTPRPTSSKRKSSNPQRSYQGKQLDKTVKTQVDIEKANSSQSKENQKSDINENDCSKNENDADSDSSQINGDVDPETVERKTKIEKLQKKIQSYDMDWEEVDRKDSIEKLQKNLETHEQNVWEDF